jgi:hypothetical protein
MKICEGVELSPKYFRERAGFVRRPGLLAEGEALPAGGTPEERAVALDTFNTQLAKLMQKLKKDAGASTIAQNYKGTGSKKHRRQLWVNFKSGAVIDLWLDTGFLQFGGVVANPPPGGTKGRPAAITYGDKTPEQVYDLAARALASWAN